MLLLNYGPIFVIVCLCVCVCLFKKGKKRRDPPRTGKRLVEVGCFLPTLDKERVTGWLEENDVSWKEVLDVVKVVKVIKVISRFGVSSKE